MYTSAKNNFVNNYYNYSVFYIKCQMLHLNADKRAEDLFEWGCFISLAMSFILDIALKIS